MRYKVFGKTGLRVSELCFGTMTFGDEWGTGNDKKESRKVFDRFVSEGGNFFDSANRYTEGTSEKMLGEFVGKNRDRYVIATKYSLFDDAEDLNATGNSRKNAIRSVEGSLRRLNTDYIDILWVHAWDFTTAPEIVMRTLDDLVSSGKVHYIGISDAPAWVFTRCNSLARQYGWAEFTALQTEYSLIERTAESDLLPAANYFDMAVTAWSPLGAGMLTGKYLNKETGRLSERSVKMNERNLNITREVVSIADEIGCTAPQVALAWIMKKSRVYFPIVGARNEAQLIDNIAAVEVKLSDEHVMKLDHSSAFEPHFPHNFLSREATKRNLFGDRFNELDM